MVARRHSHRRKERSWKVVSAFRASSDGRAYCAGFCAERHHVRLGLVAHVRHARRRSRTSPRMLLKGVKIGDRITRTISTATIRPRCSPAKGPSQSPRNLLPWRKHAWSVCVLTTTSIASLTNPRVGSGSKAASPDVAFDYQSAPRSVRANGLPEDSTTDGSLMSFGDWFMYQFWRFVFVQQMMAEELADAPGIPADATGRKLQPRCPESGNGRQDGRITQRGGGGVAKAALVDYLHFNLPPQLLIARITDK